MEQEIATSLENNFKEVNGCWEWQGSTNEGGYGMLYLKGKSLFVHRESYKIHNGKIPKEFIICHTCNNKKCYNPHHLYLGTHKDNGRDRSIAHKAGFKPKNKSTIIRLDKETHHQLKLLSIKQDTTMQKILEDLVQVALAK